MDDDNPRLPMPQSLSEQPSKKDCFLMITALSAEFPYYDFGRSGISDSYAKLLRHKLQQDGLIRVHKENGLKGISLTAKGLEKLKEKYPGRFDYVSEKSRTELSRRYRKQSFALTYCSLMNSEIEFLSDRKPFIFARSRSQPYSVSSPLLKTSMISDEPVFYSSVEIKYELEDLVQQIRNSAMTGLILSDSDCFVVYHTGENRYPLSYATERKAGIMITDGTFLESCRSNSNAIFLVKDFAVAEELITGSKKKKTAPSKVILNEAYKHIYLIPETSEGDVQFRILCHRSLSEMIEDTFYEAFGESNPGYKMINDGFDSDGAPVLNACHLDIIRLLRFKRGLLTNGIPGRILCYDFQMEFIAKLMKPAKVHINHIKIKDAEEMIKNEKI